MAETLVVKSANASVDASTAMVAGQVSGLIAGEDIAILDVCYLKSDGKVWRATAAAANAAAVPLGIAPRAAKSGQPITVYGISTVAKYSDALLTPGAKLYIGETAGRLSSIATTGDAVGIAQAIDDSNIRITRAI